MDLAFQPYGRPAPTPVNQRRRKRTAVAVTTAVAATAVVGSLGVRPDSAWFRSLAKPSWYPPQVTFPVVWTGLYATIAWASTRALSSAPVSRRRPLATTLATNLALNAGWTWTFFRAQRPGLAVLESVALDASTLSLVRAAGRHDRAAGAALVPYLAWNLFATALTEAIWFRNAD